MSTPATPEPLDRKFAASRFLVGHGIEVGALHQPLAVPPHAHVRYVDRMPVDQLRQHYPELAEFDLVDVDIIDDGEALSRVESDSQEFVIANHFLEHSQDPFTTLDNFFRVMKPQGILYLAIPDKRFIFDADRPVTPVEHLIRDYEEGPDWSREGHYDEWVRLVDKVEGEENIKNAKARLMDMEYSIHFHVWTGMDMLEMLSAFRKKVRQDFEIVVFLNNQNECIVILRKVAQ